MAARRVITMYINVRWIKVFTRWLIGVRDRQETQGPWEQCFSISLPLGVKSLNLIVAIKDWLSLPPISVLTTYTALIDWQNIICRSSPPSQIFGAKRQKQPLRWLSTSHQWEVISWYREIWITWDWKPRRDPWSRGSPWWWSQWWVCLDQRWAESVTTFSCSLDGTLR